jgi:hypothetical protein
LGGLNQPGLADTMLQMARTTKFSALNSTTFRIYAGTCFKTYDDPALSNTCQEEASMAIDQNKTLTYEEELRPDP